MRFAEHLNEGKASISPLLKSTFGKDRYGTSKEEAQELLNVFSKVGADKAVISVSTAGSNKGQYYITIHHKDGVDGVVNVAKKALDKAGWIVTKTQDKGKNEGYWIYTIKG